MEDSIWTKTAEMPTFPSLEGDVKTDVLIIGGGIAGLLCAYKLQEAGVDYMLVEAGRVCGGVTKDTTAKITSQHGFIYHKILRRFGREKARGYYEANQAALEEYRRLAQTIDCDFEEKSSYVYVKNKPSEIEKELAALTKLSVPADYVKDLPLPFSTMGAIRFERQAQFHPLKFLAALCKDLHIYENTKVKELLPGVAVTDKGKITAKKIVVATHFPFINKHGAYFLKMYQHRSYVLALENAPNFSGMYVDAQEKGMSFRRYGKYLFIGGGDHRTGEKGGCWQELSAFAEKHYPQAKVVAKWATQDCITLDDMPYIGLYARSTPDFYVTTGFNKWGMTSAMVGANLLADKILGRKNAYAEIFSPSRTILRSRFFSHVGKTVLNMLTPTVPRCPHLGCALKYNKQEHSWDCPCHGSRFTEDKKLLDNPATGDMKK